MERTNDKKIICIDASFIIRLAISGTSIPSFSHLWTQWELQGYSKIAPSLFYSDRLLYILNLLQKLPPQ